jgi:hypothetical protein
LDRYVPDDLLDTINALKQERDRAYGDALRAAAEPLYRALKAIQEFHGHCWCGECNESKSFVCVETQETIDEFLSLTPPAIRLRAEIRELEIRFDEAQRCRFKQRLRDLSELLHAKRTELAGMEDSK